MISFTKAGHAENERLKSLIAGEGLPWAGYRAGTAPGGEALLKVGKNLGLGSGWMGKRRLSLYRSRRHCGT
mgnify:CR=1 FL=1